MKRNAIIILLILSLSMVNGYAISLCNAKDIEYKASDTTWDVDTVEDALNDLYENNSCSISDTLLEYLKQPLVFSYTGGSQIFVVPVSGTYKIELWGARGGRNNWTNTMLNDYGFGGYTSGEIYLRGGVKLYVYVGEQGKDGVLVSRGSTGIAFNGGGAGKGDLDGNDGGGSGGGATDVRLVGGEWNNFESLKSRIMVAGAGGGGATIGAGFSIPSSGNGGGLTGVGNYWKYPSTSVDSNYNATQTSGYKFGIGSDGVIDLGEPRGGGAGAGGGYYGGSTYPSMSGGSGGGSSFISGHNGCNAILEESTADDIKHSGQSKHYSNLVFTNTRMVDGEGYEWTDVRGEKTGMPTFDGLSTMNGNASGGYAKITFINTH